MFARVAMVVVKMLDCKKISSTFFSERVVCSVALVNSILC